MFILRWRRRSTNPGPCYCNGFKHSVLCLPNYVASALFNIFLFIVLISCCFKNQLNLVRTIRKLRKKFPHPKQTVFCLHIAANSIPEVINNQSRRRVGAGAGLTIRAGVESELEFSIFHGVERLSKNRSRIQSLV